jgi:hypothetical protein
MESTSAFCPASPLPLGGGIGQHKARGDTINRDAVGPKLQRELLGQAYKGVLGRAIGLDAGQARAQASARRDGDNAPVFLRFHPRRGSLGAPEGGVHIGGKELMPIMLGDVFQRLGHLAPHAAGGQCKHVDAAEQLDDLGEPCLHLAAIGKIERHGVLGACRLGFQQPLRVKVKSDDARAGVSESRNDGAANALGGAGDDRAFTGEI